VARHSDLTFDARHGLGERDDHAGLEVRAALRSAAPAAREAQVAEQIAEQIAEAREDVVEAGANGASDGMKLAINVAAMLIAAVALIQMGVCPGSVINIPFGGDNHTDANLARESAQTVAGVATINNLMTKLAAAGLQVRVTFVMMNVFGRTLNRPLRMGRDHLGSHHCSVIIGKRVRGSVVGGVVKSGNDYAATPIDSRTGLPGGSADIRYEETLAAVGKTISAAVGISPEVVSDQITLGKVVSAALVS